MGYNRDNQSNTIDPSIISGAIEVVARGITNSSSAGTAAASNYRTIFGGPGTPAVNNQAATAPTGAFASGLEHFPTNTRNAYMYAYFYSIIHTIGFSTTYYGMTAVTDSHSAGYASQQSLLFANSAVKNLINPQAYAGQIQGTYQSTSDDIPFTRSTITDYILGIEGTMHRSSGFVDHLYEEAKKNYPTAFKNAKAKAITGLVDPKNISLFSTMSAWGATAAFICYFYEMTVKDRHSLGYTVSKCSTYSDSISSSILNLESFAYSNAIGNI